MQALVFYDFVYPRSGAQSFDNIQFTFQLETPRTRKIPSYILTVLVIQLLKRFTGDEDHLIVHSWNVTSVKRNSMRDLLEKQEENPLHLE